MADEQQTDTEDEGEEENSNILLDADDEEEEDAEEDVEEEEDLFNKDTPSFQCFTQVLISRSSLLRNILYPFPPMKDPGIGAAFDYVEPEVRFDDVGCEKYKLLCKNYGITPLSRILKSLPTDTMDLKSYSLSMIEMKTLCSTMMINTHVNTIILEENFMSPDACFWIGEMLRESNTLQMLNMKECRIGYNGTLTMIEGLSLNQSLTHLDLSFNELGDNGICEIINAISDSINLTWLNFSHNNLGMDSSKVLGTYIGENNIVTYLDLSWNFFNTGPGMKLLCAGLTENKAIRYLDLAWNGLEIKPAVGPITKYLKENETLQYLNLSSNRIGGECLQLLKAAIAKNKSLISVNLSANIITPDDAFALMQCFSTKGTQLRYMDLDNVFVEKRFLPMWRRLAKQGKTIRIQGVINDYKIVGPNAKQLLFNRCTFLGQKPKQKKKKRDFGLVLYTFPDACVEKKDFAKMLKKNKLKFDKDLINTLQNAFATTGKVDLTLMKKTYMDLHPDFVPPSPPPKKGKKGKKGKKEQKDATTLTELTVPVNGEPAAGTDRSSIAIPVRSVTMVTDDEHKSKREILVDALRKSMSSKTQLEKSTSVMTTAKSTQHVTIEE